MPPKKKQGVVIDGVDTTSMTREQIEVFALNIKEQNEREREQRNFFQLERDKIRTFWEITRNELEESRAKLRNKDRQIEEAAEKNYEELRFYKQKVKHHQYEHQNDLTQCKTDAVTSLKKATDDHAQQEWEILKDKRDLKISNRQQEVASQEQLRAFQIEHSRLVDEARKDFENKARETELKYEKKFNLLKHELDTKHKMEMAEVDERKNKQISELKDYHEKSFIEMKNYYNDITLNNLALISSLKEQMEGMQKQNERMTKQVADLTSENSKLAGPLRVALSDLAQYKREMQNYEKDKISLANTKAKLFETKKELDNLVWTNTALELRFEKLQAERDTLESRFVKAILEVQQKTSLKNELLHRRVQTLHHEAEVKEAAIGLLSTAAKETPKIQYQSLEKLLVDKNSKIKDLEYELAMVCKAHDDMLETYEEKLIEYGIPKKELGFKPMRFLPKGQSGLARGPAGLVTKNNRRPQ
ncbi:dynein regulatory complex subunit 4-like [Photinus pyralis]|uniref:dynein regulatory complex subunit 4-like n=1 Tax=Photinus pyralis TaxID=7054 RepID=UPI001267613A|nr:dynein regulatory complex subunit 4-like [Photinus pyralis]